MRYRYWKIALLVAVGCCLTTSACAAEECETVTQMFSKGMFSGAIGSYGEWRNNEAENSDYSWVTVYTTLKYETLRYKHAKFGARVFTHTNMWSDDDDGVTDPFKVDIERKYTIPELYVDYSFFDDSSVRIGRWAHQKISHIDDAQSEGAYVLFNEIPDVDLVFGMMRRFAEIDYDDGEDFGRENDTQDLGHEPTYGDSAKPQMLFLEARTNIADTTAINPYFMYQDGYASVYGLDTAVAYDMEDIDVQMGERINVYFVDAHIAGSDDALCFAISPYLQKKPIRFEMGFAQFDDDAALNKPAWLRDYVLGVVDQVAAYGQAGSNVYFGKIKYARGKFWTHVAYADYEYNATASAGDRTEEFEWQCGYALTKNFDVNIRLFDVQRYYVDNKDYQKVEARVRFRF